ncbi:hypothetical protein DCO49_00255 [Stenotrophomonas sp. SPM]|uniref:hypothetical protein n=1 Tax=Stenotrophomonas sp. SPM TaxID=2170735 RepID=UPI000DE7704A|nr:hypothetical protein [Stenotrophomonas sp. SPM]PWB29836.1 hypothetical protein DCO49_00255 [Stenotrophomonas sp. SPM]
MINLLLDPNQIPLVRAPERRAVSAVGTDFEQAAGLPSSPDVLAVFELEVQDARGTEHRIALPWGLAANDRLSQETSAAGWGTQVFLLTQPASSTAVPPSGMRSAAAPMLGCSPASLELPTSTTQQIQPAQSAALRLSAAVMEPIDAAPPARSAVETGSPWQARWQQWLRGQGEDLKVRLRDYRLQEDDYPQLIAQLHRFARDQGLTMTRLTVNGRELWHLPTSESGHRHGR